MKKFTQFLEDVIDVLLPLIIAILLSFICLAGLISIVTILGSLL